jgi:HEPN domain-containing protein
LWSSYHCSTENKKQEVKMTKRECAIVMAYTGVCMLAGENFSIFLNYVEEKLGRTVYTHELPELADEIKEKTERDFLKLCKTASDEGNEKERIHNMIDEEIKKLQPSYKHIAAIKLLESMKEKI